MIGAVGVYAIVAVAGFCWAAQRLMDWIVPPSTLPQTSAPRLIAVFVILIATAAVILGAFAVELMDVHRRLKRRDAEREHQAPHR
jgi:hypothetical protein